LQGFTAEDVTSFKMIPGENVQFFERLNNDDGEEGKLVRGYYQTTVGEAGGKKSVRQKNSMTVFV